MDNNNATQNTTDLTSLISCLQPQFFKSSSEFFNCYALLYRYNWARATGGILLALLTFVLNTLVIILLVKKPFKKTIFDQILIAHCVVDGVTGLVDIPFFHFQDLFGYWPFGDLGAHFWAVYDNGINVITNLHMLYMTWVRFRSITAPNTYEKELIARKPKLIFVLIWLIGVIIWIPVVIKYGVVDYTVDVDYKYKAVELLLISSTWFLPLVSIFVLSVVILVILNRRTRRKIDMKSSLAVKSQHTNTGMESMATRLTSRQVILMRLRNFFHLGPQIRFQIIIISYCIQWFPSCLIALINPICNQCIEPNVIGAVYWLTYTVCFTDPLVILIFNPNVTIQRARVTPH